MLKPLLPLTLCVLALATQTACSTSSPPARSGIDRADLDPTVKPGDDFFQYVNGNWIARNPIPPEYSRWGSFGKLRDDNLSALRRIIDDLSAPGSKQQRFFLGYAQVWRDAVRDAELKVNLRTDPHAPSKFRTLVPLSNFGPFYEAFGVKPGDGMYRKPAERVEVW